MIVVWRDTLGDDMVAVRNFSCDIKEQTAVELKDWKVDFDKVVTANINHFPDTFNTKAVLYYPDLNQYV